MQKAQESPVAEQSVKNMKQMLLRTIVRYHDHKTHLSDDQILVESPLTIVLNRVPLATLECTPGNDLDLAIGFCITEQLIEANESVHLIQHTRTQNGAEVSLRVEGGQERVYNALQQKGVRVSSACYGNASPVATDMLPRMKKDFFLTPDQVHSLQKEAEAGQVLFSNTGATHFCALYNSDLSLIAYSEDVGRHNALDKSIGQTKQLGCLEDIRLILLSSRVSHEMVRKSATVNAQIIAGFSAVTTSAISLAEQSNRTLVGFLRNGRMNIYSHGERLGFSSPNPEFLTTAASYTYAS